MAQSEKVMILVKALPHAGEKHGETVCCAGLTAEGHWKRLFPVKFRSLKDDDKFKRWQWVEYDWIPPSNDRRSESQHIQHGTLKIVGSQMPIKQRAKFLAPYIETSPESAAEKGKTLTLIRPQNVKFSYAMKTAETIAQERQSYQRAAAQKDLFDEDLDALEPCPYKFTFVYDTANRSGRKATCDDWETAAMFYNLRHRYGEEAALKRMMQVFNETYPAAGMVFAMGTHSRYPDTWLLVGVIRLDEVDQLSMSF